MIEHNITKEWNERGLLILDHIRRETLISIKLELEKKRERTSKFITSPQTKNNCHFRPWNRFFKKIERKRKSLPLLLLTPIFLLLLQLIASAAVTSNSLHRFVCPFSFLSLYLSPLQSHAGNIPFHLSLLQLLRLSRLPSFFLLVAHYPTHSSAKDENHTLSSATPPSFGCSVRRDKSLRIFIFFLSHQFVNRILSGSDASHKLQNPLCSLPEESSYSTVISGGNN